MKKLHSLAFYALVTPALALSSGAVLAEKSSEKDASSEQMSSQNDQQTGQQTGQSYLESAPAGGIQASNLVGAEIKSNDDEDVGSVTDLIIDQDGKVAALVVGVGGFLGMAEKDVAIGWDEVTVSSDSEESDELELRINMTRDDLEAAPSFEDLDD